MSNNVIEYNGECIVCRGHNIKTESNFDGFIDGGTTIGFNCVCNDCGVEFHPTDNLDRITNNAY